MWEDAKEAIRQSSPESSVYIGCDSVRFKKDGDWYARYATVIIVHKDSCHGCRVFHNTEVLRDYGKTTEGLKNRMLTEVNYAVMAATDVLEDIGDRHLEIHLDVNPNPVHKSNIAAKEALGWVLGMGFIAMIKPDGWAASTAADHAVHNKSFAR
jgi:hypothetical protein